MSSRSIGLTYRPIRVGWCLERGDFEGFRHAMRTNFTWWGGRFNPVIPVDDAAEAKQLYELFRVDVLVAARDTPAAKAFIEGNPHIGWFQRTQRLVLERGAQSRVSAIADIIEPMNRIYEERYRSNPAADPVLALHGWDANDPLADMLLATFGGLPPAAAMAEDYRTPLQIALRGQPVNFLPGQPIATPPGLMSIAQFNKSYVERHTGGPPQWQRAGVYVGDVSNFDDLLNFWNLRAADVPLIFYDPAHAARLDMFRDQWCGGIRVDPLWPMEPGEGIPIRHAAARDPGSLGALPEPHILSTIGPATWNGRDLRVPVMAFGTAETLASIDNDGQRPSVSFSLPDRPIATASIFDGQAYVVSVETGRDPVSDERFTLQLPYVPELNQFYGGSIFYPREAVRAEPGSIGLVVSASMRHLSLNAIETSRLFNAIFDSVGIATAPSPAGLVCTGLLRQMGGIGGCRVFRVGGVRTLIEKYDPDRSFSKSNATQIIHGMGGPHPIENYKTLHIEPMRFGQDLSSSAVFAHLLAKELFRPGLKLDCPNCRLDFWRSLDEVGTRNACEYCGHVFNLAPQLKDRDWAFRRSGLFGRRDNQQGAIPVALTLQQLSDIYALDPQHYATATLLEPKGADIAACETDFLFLAPRHRGHRIELAIGECKTRGAIEEKDVDNLLRVANAFPKDRFDVFIVFAKLCDFDEEEIDLIKRVNAGGEQRAILLTERELEPLFIYERTSELFEVNTTPMSLADLAEATVAIFFDKRLKKKPRGQAPPAGKIA